MKNANTFLHDEEENHLFRFEIQAKMNIFNCEEQGGRISKFFFFLFHKPWAKSMRNEEMESSLT